MTPATARDLRRARVAQLRQDEPDLSHREMAQRLGISKDTVRRDLDALDAAAAQSAPPAEPSQAPPAAPVAHRAPQVSEVAEPPGATGPGPVAQAAPLPQRVADPLEGMDVSQWRALRRDLAVLAQTGTRAETLVYHAVTAYAYAYRQALARGELTPGQPVLITGVSLRPSALLADRPAS